jgi:hypothetical protein
MAFVAAAPLMPHKFRHAPLVIIFAGPLRRTRRLGAWRGPRSRAPARRSVLWDVFKRHYGPERSGRTGHGPSLYTPQLPLAT